MVVKNSNNDDYNPVALAGRIDGHARDMKSISERLEKMEARLGTSEKIGDTFCEVIGNYTKIQEKLKTICSDMIMDSKKVEDTIVKVVKESGSVEHTIARMVNDSEEVKKTIVEITQKMDRQWWQRCGVWILGGIWSLLLVIGTAWVQNYFHGVR